jgi:hypothetical protein
VFVVPILLARLGIERIDVVESSRHIHDAMRNDRRCRKHFLDLGLKNPGGAEFAHIRRVDLLAQEISGLMVVAVGMKKVVLVASRGVKLILRHRRRGGRLRQRHIPPGHAKHQRAGQSVGQFPTRHLKCVPH